VKGGYDGEESYREIILLGGKEAFGGGGYISVEISSVRSLVLGVFGEPLQGAPGCWGFWAWGP